MFALDNANADAAEIILAVATFLGLIAAILYALGTRPVTTGADVQRVNVAVWAPVVLSLALGATALAWWVA
jgi:hypothetical protein